MSQSWKKLDLGGDGLQTINLQFNRLQKKLSSAIIYWCFFPLGLHQIYLRQYRKATLYLLLSSITIAFLYFPLLDWRIAAGVLGVLSLWDLVNLPNDVTHFNKALKIELYLQKGKQMPADFRGRYTDDSEDNLKNYMSEKEQERAGHQPVTNKQSRSKQHIMSFAEQEALLKEMQTRKKKNQDN